MKLFNLNIEDLSILVDAHFLHDSISNQEIRAVIFEFKFEFLIIEVNENDDTVLVDLKRKGNNSNNNSAQMLIKRLGLIKFSKNSTFNSLVKNVKGRRITYIWKLTNQRGYEDGIQLEFIDKNLDHRKLICIQFIAISSSLYLHSVKDL